MTKRIIFVGEVKLEKEIASIQKLMNEVSEFKGTYLSKSSIIRMALYRGLNVLRKEYGPLDDREL